jgi:hypothetical protein
VESEAGNDDFNSKSLLWTNGWDEALFRADSGNAGFLLFIGVPTVVTDGLFVVPDKAACQPEGRAGENAVTA